MYTRSRCGGGQGKVIGGVVSVYCLLADLERLAGCACRAVHACIPTRLAGIRIFVAGIAHHAGPACRRLASQAAVLLIIGRARLSLCSLLLLRVQQLISE
jgi:hypothetical protein